MCRWQKSERSFLFQVIAERAERATLIVTTNLPFSEWTQVFPNLRLCKALLDRITDRAHIIETGARVVSFPAHGRRTAKEESLVGTVGLLQGCGQRKGLKTPPFPAPHPGSEPGKRELTTQGWPNESIKRGPNQVVKRIFQSNARRAGKRENLFHASHRDNGDGSFAGSGDTERSGYS